MNTKVSKEEIIRLRTEERMSIKDIKQTTGLSRARIHLILSKSGTPTPTFPELLNPETFTERDEVIAAELKVPLHQVSKSRKALNIKHPHKVSLGRRHRSLVRSLFGSNYLPGPNFSLFVREQIDNLPNEHQKVLIIDFYLNGLGEASADNINSDSDRVYRSLIKKRLKEIVKTLSTEDLVSQGVLKEL